MTKIFILLQLVDKLNTNSSFDDLKEDYEVVSIYFIYFVFFYFSYFISFLLFSFILFHFIC